jgi:hypothetical protein
LASARKKALERGFWVSCLSGIRQDKAFGLIAILKAWGVSGSDLAG